MKYLITLIDHWSNNVGNGGNYKIYKMRITNYLHTLDYNTLCEKANVTVAQAKRFKYDKQALVLLVATLNSNGISL